MIEKYRLLRDLPGVKAGAIVEIDGGVVTRGDAWIIPTCWPAAYPEWFEKVEEKPYPDPRSPGLGFVWREEDRPYVEKAYDAFRVVLRRCLNGEINRESVATICSYAHREAAEDWATFLRVLFR